MAELSILIAGGGTGGHIIPALAVARELVERHGAEVLFVGTARGWRCAWCPRPASICGSSMWARSKTYRCSPGCAPSPVCLRSIFDCKRLIREFQPGAVLGVGGYASGPAMAAALWLKIPAMAFEPNAMPGLANRLVGKRVQAAAVNFPAAAKWFRNAEVTGVPVRPEFFSLQPPPGDPHLLVFGGSLGARIFNTYLPQLLPALLLDAVPGLTVLHQSGVRNVAATEAAYAASGADPSRWQVSPFLDDMPSAFARAHLVMSRSGASTVAELAAAGKPALLVPFAAAADEHQRRNAEAMVAAGAAVMLQEKDLEIPEKLLAALIGLLTTPDAAGCHGRRCPHPGASRRRRAHRRSRCGAGAKKRVSSSAS